jgi:hypothetical protein
MRVLGGPYGPEPHNVLLYFYEGTNITGEKVVNPHKTQLNDALIAFERHLDLFQSVIDELNRLTIRTVFDVVRLV